MEPEEITYANFWKRLAAYLIDYFLIGIFCLVIGLFGAFGGILRLLIPAIYLIGFWNATGQTPGKAAVGLKVIRLDGANIGLREAVLRFIGYIISAIIFFVGFLMIGWHEKKRGLHDLIASTVVINVPSVIAEVYSKAEMETALLEADNIQRKYHGV